MFKSVFCVPNNTLTVIFDEERGIVRVKEDHFTL